MNKQYKYTCLLVFLLATTLSNLYGRSAPHVEDLINKSQNCRVTDSLALIALYNSTNGVFWDFNLPMDTWFGVRLNDEGCVSSLSISDRLTGTIPPELGNLSQVERLNLSDNDLTGTIPSELGNLSTLEELYLDGNDLSGAIPHELGNLNTLERLSLFSNQLSGSIPFQLGNLSTLQVLLLYSNQLSGNIPPQLENLSNLFMFNLRDNQLSGSIPPQLGNLHKLRWIYLENNQLTGMIPSELGNLSALIHLYLFNNSLTGMIPPELADISGLTLNVEYNNLSGCFHANLIQLCRSTDNITEGNNFDVPFTDFCSSDAGVCPGSCPPVINLSNNIEDNIYHASQVINTNSTVPSGYNPILKAGININIFPGFNAEIGSTISFEIEACSNE